MELEQLKIYLAVVENASFTKAAETLYISHSTTSRTVSALEESLGVRLLNRDSRSVSTTEAGRLLYNEGRRLLAEAETLKEAVRAAADSVSGSLTVASVDLFSEALTALYAEFGRRFPDVAFAVCKKGLSEILEQVERQNADVGVTFSYALPDRTDGLRVCSIARERFCLICAPDDPLAAKKSVRPEELPVENYVSVGAQRSGFTKNLEDELLRGRARATVRSVPTLESLFLRVSSGGCVSMVPRPIAKAFGQSCACVELEGFDTSFDVVAIWREDNITPALKSFAALLEKKE
ncbi:MAG: LysR family transcriptional regulator [Oscillospiraceae bacterium]